MAASSTNQKLAVGVSMLRDARIGEFDAVRTTLGKLLGNIQASPTEPKFRKIRQSNAKIAELLATRGVRAILTGAGFVQEGEFLVLPEDAPLDAVAAAIAAIEAQAVERADAAGASKAALVAAKKEADKENEEERKRMKMGIADDAAARKEPGWTAKAAGVKGGREITGCADIGVGTSSGG